MDKLDYAILNALQETQATTSLSSLSRKQLLEDVDIKGQNLFIRLKKLVSMELVKKGIKDGREHTYFITEAGIKELREALG